MMKPIVLYFLYASATVVNCVYASQQLKENVINIDHTFKSFVNKCAYAVADVWSKIPTGKTTLENDFFEAERYVDDADRSKHQKRKIGNIFVKKLYDNMSAYTHINPKTGKIAALDSIIKDGVISLFEKSGLENGRKLKCAILLSKIVSKIYTFNGNADSTLADIEQFYVSRFFTKNETLRGKTKKALSSMIGGNKNISKVLRYIRRKYFDKQAFDVLSAYKNEAYLVKNVINPNSRVLKSYRESSKVKK